MYIQRIRPNEIQHSVFYFMLMNCANFKRNEILDYRERNLVSYLEDVSKFTLKFWMPNKNLHRSAKLVAQTGLKKIAGANSRNDFLAMRHYLKETQTAYQKVAFGEDYIDLVQEEIKMVLSQMGETSYGEFVSDPIRVVFIDLAINNILDKATKMNLVK